MVYALFLSPKSGRFDILKPKQRGMTTPIKMIEISRLNPIARDRLIRSGVAIHRLSMLALDGSVLDITIELSYCRCGPMYFFVSDYTDSA